MFNEDLIRIEDTTTTPPPGVKNVKILKNQGNFRDPLQPLEAPKIPNVKILKKIRGPQGFPPVGWIRLG